MYTSFVFITTKLNIPEIIFQTVRNLLNYTHLKLTQKLNEITNAIKKTVNREKVSQHVWNNPIIFCYMRTRFCVLI